MSGVCVYTMFLVKDLYNNRALDDLFMKLQIFFISLQPDSDFVNPFCRDLPES